MSKVNRNYLKKHRMKKHFLGKIRIDYIDEKVLRVTEMENNLKSGYEIIFKRNIPVKIIEWNLGKKIKKNLKNLKLKTPLKNFKYSFKILEKKCLIKSFSTKNNLKSELIEIKTEILESGKIESYIIKGYMAKVGIMPLFIGKLKTPQGLRYEATF